MFAETAGESKGGSEGWTAGRGGGATERAAVKGLLANVTSAGKGGVERVQRYDMGMEARVTGGDTGVEAMGTAAVVVPMAVVVWGLVMNMRVVVVMVARVKAVLAQRLRVTAEMATTPRRHTACHSRRNQTRARNQHSWSPDRRRHRFRRTPNLGTHPSTGTLLAAGYLVRLMMVLMAVKEDQTQTHRNRQCTLCWCHPPALGSDQARAT